jgi:hypothetical protein
MRPHPLFIGARKRSFNHWQIEKGEHEWRK